MESFKSKVRTCVKKIYHKFNPQYKYILQINDEVYKLNNKIEELERNNIEKKAEVNSEIDIDRLLLGTDIRNARYLYLLRYIRENDKVLDIEGKCGTGADILTKYTPIDYCECINSIDYYTEIAKIYYVSESVNFYTANWNEVKGKYNIITFFDENKTNCLTKESIKQLYERLEFSGILAISLKQNLKVDLFEKIGFKIEKKLYQSIGNAELKENDDNCNITVIYFRKDE